MPLTHRVSKSTWYILLVIYTSMMGMTLGSIVYANHVATRSAQQWCNVITTLDDAYKSQPPTTPTGKKIASEMHDLKISLRCK
jgi:hypothetical protein